MIKVMIADDHVLIREGLKKLLSKESDISVQAEAQSVDEVIQHIEGGQFDVLVLDISMPGGNGLDLLKDLKQRFPSLNILILSIHPEEFFAVRALRSGASGYLTKETAADEVVKAIRKVAGGGRYVSPSLAERLASELNEKAGKSDHQVLSDREFQVFRMIAEGKTISAIAEELYLSKSTVNTYRARVLRKMNMKSSAEIIHYAIRNRLLE
jgi:two-component system invasion response regulator UvrY